MPTTNYAVYDKRTGQLVSTGTVLEELPAHLGYATFETDGGRYNGTRFAWDTSLRRMVRVDLIASADTLVANGSAAVTVTYTDERSDAPATVTFDVNGATQDATVTQGVAAIDINANSPDDIITVACMGLTVQIRTV